MSRPLSIELGYEVDCTDSPLDRQLLSRGGVTVVRDGMSFHALDPGLRQLAGWPYRAPGFLQEWTYPASADEEGGLDCGVYADPALGPDGTLFVPLDVSDASGGSLLAMARDGQAVPGWPVTLRRAGSGFWKVAVGGDGTVFAAAVEREKGGLSSTILAIAPDSTIGWRTTVVEP